MIHHPVFLYAAIPVVLAGGLMIVFRLTIAGAFEKLWALSISKPLIPTTPRFFALGGAILVGAGIVSAVRAFL